MSTKIDHVAIAVETLERSLAFWSETLGLEVRGMETVPTEGVRVAFLGAGASTLELLEPTDESSPIARHLSRRGGGIHHLTLEVENLAAMLERLRGRGVQLLGDAPRPGAGGRAVAFLHPRSTGGVLLELVQREEDEPGEGRAEIAPGSTVLAYLRDPQEKIWGVVRKLEGAGLVIEGIDLASFDDWISQLERDEESVAGPSVLFLPMARVEKILLDRSSGSLPSLADRFERRTGRSIREVLDHPT